MSARRSNGLAMALALGGPAARRPLDVVVVDARDPPWLRQHGIRCRASAITAAARRMFEALGIWPKIAHHAEAMAEIIVTDSADPKRVRCCCPSMRRTCRAGPPPT